MEPAATAPETNLTVERLKSLYELIRRMNSVYELPELLEFVVDRALNLAGGRRGLLLLNNSDELTPHNVAVVRGESLDIDDLERVQKFISTTVIADVLKKGEARLVLDLPSDARYEGQAQNTLKFKQVRSVLAVPLRAESQQVGLLYIDHPRKAAFGQDELDFLNAFANQAALAINRARTHRRQVEELTLLNELSRSVVKVLDLNEVLTRIVAEVSRILDVEASSVLLLDEESGELVFSTAVQNGRRLNISTRLKKEQGIAGWVMAHGQPIFVNDVRHETRWFGEVKPGFETHSLLCVPLHMDGRSVGVLEALNKKGPGGFNNGDITLLSAFAASATIAIENARLFQEARQARQLRALNDIAMKLSSTLDLNTILDEGLAQLLTVLKAEAGAVLLSNPQAQTDVLSVQLGPEAALDESRQARQTEALAGLASWLLEQSIDELGAANLFVFDAAHPVAPAQAAIFARAGVAALAMTPLEVGGVVAGGLVVAGVQPHTFSLEETSLLGSVARIMGLAAQNAINYMQVQAQTGHLKYLNEIGSMLTRSLDKDSVLKVIIEGVNSLLQTELTSVFLIDDASNELVLRYTTKGNADIRLPAPWQGIAGWVASHDEPALVNNTHDDPRHLRQIAIDTGYQADSILCVPLKVEGRVIGVVEVLNKTGGQQFTTYHQSLLLELSRWAAIALHNARLFDERIQAYERLNAEQQRRVVAETRGAMAAVILDMAHTMNNVVGAIRAWALALEYAADDTPAAPLAGHRKVIKQIRQNTEEALKLMGTMTGPLEQVEVTAVEVHRCLDAAVQSCWWPDNVTYAKNYEPQLPPVEANPERLEAVFHNLISNAVQALGQTGGRVELATRHAGGQVEIIIADNGPGIPPELQRRVFNPGVSGKDGSLGIGLWLVETFVHQFNGRISFVSGPTGTTFTVSLPAL